MKSKDMLEDYLLSLGVSIKNKYTFLPKTEYDFKEKKKDETVTLGKYKVELTKQYANSRELRLMLNGAKDNFINKITVTDDMHETCENILKNSITYFTDVIKYLDSILELKPEVMEKLIILCNGGITNVGKEIESALSEYNVKIAQAKAEGAAEYQSSLASSMAEIESKKSTYVTIDSYNDPLYGNRAIGYVSSGFSDKAMAEGMMIGAQQAAAMIASIPVDVENKKAKEKISGIRENIIKKFNSSIFEFISAKFPKDFDEDILYNNGDNLEENPTYHQYYLEVTKDLKEDELEDFSKAIKFYDIKIENTLKSKLEDEIVNYYLKNFKCDYDSSDYQLFKYLKFDEKALLIRVGSRLHNYFLDLPNPENKKKYFKAIDELQPKLEACDYITDEDKKKIIDTYDNCKTKLVKNKRSHRIDVLLSIISVIAYLLTAGIAIFHSITFEIYPEYGFSGWTFLGVLIFGAIVIFTIKSDEPKIKKIILGILIILFAGLSIYYVPRIINEYEYREGKVLIKKSYPDKETAEYIPIGQTFELENISESGYYFNGWISYNEDYIVFGTQTAKRDAKYSANLVETSTATTKVTFKSKNGDKDIIMYQMPGSQVYIPKPPTKKGYRFNGWYNKTKKEIFNDFLYRVDEQNVVFEARWEKE